MWGTKSHGAPTHKKAKGDFAQLIAVGTALTCGNAPRPSYSSRNPRPQKDRNPHKDTVKAQGFGVRVWGLGFGT